MAYDGDFKHIKVTPPDQDEIIEAGLPANVESRKDVQVKPDEAAEPKAYDAVGAPPRSAGRDVRQQTRLQRTTADQRMEDLNASPMPLAQKIVIIAALILIIVAFVYYFCAMR